MTGGPPRRADPAAGRSRSGGPKVVAAIVVFDPVRVQPDPIDAGLIDTDRIEIACWPAGRSAIPLGRRPLAAARRRAGT